jgi:hypothetical protein
MHQNALHDLQIPPDTKTQVVRNLSGCAFSVNRTLPPEHEKYFVDVSCLECNRLHYMTRRSHQIQKHKFDITCPNALLVESVSVPPVHEI